MYDRRFQFENILLIPASGTICVDVITGKVYQLMGYAGYPIFMHDSWSQYLTIY
jgi:hypothetical protein